MKIRTLSLTRNTHQSIKRSLWNSLCVSTGLAFALTLASAAPSLAQASANPQKPTSASPLLLPTALPPKTSAAMQSSASQTTPKPATPAGPKVATKKSGSKRATLKSGKKDAPEGVATTLPAFKGTKRIVINFDSSTETKQPTVVVRTELPLEKSAADKSRAESDAKAGSVVTVVKPSIQALPSSTFIEVSENGGDDPAKSSMPQNETRPSAAPTLSTKTVNDAVATKPAPLPEPDPELQAALDTSPQVQAMEKPAASPGMNTTNVTTTITVVPPATAKNVSVSVLDAVPTDDEFASPRREKRNANEQASAIVERSESEIPREKTEPKSASLTATAPRAAHDSALSSYRVHLRTAYLDARYSRLEDRLQNGATSMGVGLSRDLGEFEARLAFDMLHGLDQSVSAQNIRMTVARVDVARLLSGGTIRPYFSGGLGLADYNVRSYRSTSDSLITLKEHAKGMAIALIPAAGARISFDPNLTLDLQAEYLAMIGSNAPAIGGLGGAASLGFGF